MNGLLFYGRIKTLELTLNELLFYGRFKTLELTFNELLFIRLQTGPWIRFPFFRILNLLFSQCGSGSSSFSNADTDSIFPS